MQRAEAHLARLDSAERAILRRHTLGSISSSALDHELALLARDRQSAADELAAARDAASGVARAAIRAETVASVLSDLRQALAAAEGADRYQVVRALVASGAALLECYTREVELPISLAAPGEPIDLGSEAGCSSTLPERIPDFLRFRVVA